MSTAVIGAPEFRARSGRKVQIRDNGTVTFDHANGYLSPETAMDADEFFQAQRDLELGRWRCPAEPDWVAQEDEPDVYGRRTVRLFNERAFEMHHLNSLVTEGTTSGELAKHRVARAFFEAHPQVKPWHGAQAGEFWQVQHMGMTETCRVDDVYGVLRFTGVDGGATSVTMPVTHHSIRHARRMGIEDAS